MSFAPSPSGSSSRGATSPRSRRAPAGTADARRRSRCRIGRGGTPASRAAGTHRRDRASALPGLEVTDVEVVAPPEDGGLGMSAPKRKRPVWRVVHILLAVAVVAISFLYAIPKIANYSEVWTEIRDMTR